MNKGAIKTFAIWARNKLMADVKSNAHLIGIREDGIQNPLPQSTTEIEYYDIGSAKPYALTGDDLKKREKIISRLQYDINDSDYKTAYRNLLEHTASTWFNRLCAIRFMEVNDYFDDGLRVLSSSEEGKRESDLMSSPFDSDLELTDSERVQVREWKLNNNSEELFVFLLKKKCRQLSTFLPGLFENEDDCTDLLVHFSIFDKAGIIDHLVNDIDEEDWKEQVQIIGWLYQFYNTEFKDETYRIIKKQVLTKERIPSVTQLFTPEWIVKYLVENSLGRIWLDGHPYSKSTFLPTEEEQTEYVSGKHGENDHKWHYYLEEPEQESAVQAQLDEVRKGYATLNPEDLSFIDPCLGSGHIICYAFDVLMQIYTEQGYTARDAVSSIIANNLYGLDIDERAYQLAYFSIMMKARQYDRGAFRRGLIPRVYAFEESNQIKPKELEIFGAGLSPIEKNVALDQMKELLIIFKDAKELGSIIKVSPMNWRLLEDFASSFSSYGDITMLAEMPDDISELQKKLQRIINVGELLSRQYQVTCTNPPYMAPTPIQRPIVEKYYKEAKPDLYSVFILKLKELTLTGGLQAMITMHGWLFLSSFEKLRKRVFLETIVNMVHLGARAFEEIGGEVVQTAAFILLNRRINGHNGIYYRLTEPSSQNGKEELFLSNNNRYTANQEDFSKIPGLSCAYWLSDSFKKAFSYNQLNTVAKPRQGLATGDNSSFLRLWSEVSIQKIGFDCKSRELALQSKLKWFPCNKGGSFRKWYGNNDYVVNWENDGKEIRNCKDEKGRVKSRPQNTDYYFKEGMTWSTIANRMSMRYSPEGFMFETKGSVCFPNKKEDLRYLLGLTNSKVITPILAVLSPTLDFHEGPLGKVPVVFSEEHFDEVSALAEECIRTSKEDWDSLETSWDFKRHPFIKYAKASESERSLATQDSFYIQCPIEYAYTNWMLDCDERFEVIKENEEELNRIFINIYGLEDELTPEIDDEDVTVCKADLQRDIRSFISYAVGCMFGRYSLDVEGLAYAGGDWEEALESRYKSFIPDEDNCIPITDENYFSDDIVGRFVEFVKVVFGDETLKDNLQFIADALGGKGDEPIDVIRGYFLNDFFKDHCNYYSTSGSGKRPIYWLFDSGKQNGFKSLVYMHRWDSNTVATVRTRYVAKVQEKYENELRSMDLQMEHLSDPRQKASLQKRKEKITKQVTEIRKYDELIGHMALEYIDIDLDDGVKVNHEKVQIDRNGDKYQILAPIK